MVALWAAAAVYGWHAMLGFSTTPGGQAAAPRVLPAQLGALSQGKPMPNEIFVALHPQCSCSVATLRELVRIVGQSGAASSTGVSLLLYRPQVLPAHWQSSSLPGVAASLHPRLIPDIDGRLAAALHASTSGEVVLYSGAGRLLAQGGITPGRGHQGASDGGARLLRALQTRTPQTTLSQVFGCPILTHREAPTP